MTRGSNLERVTRLQSALRKVKAGDKLSHAELSLLWGVGKGAFSNLRNRIADFPAGEDGPRNTVLYDAPAALKALLEYETRADEAEMARQARAAEILGMNRGAGRRKKAEVFLPPADMLKLSRLRAEIEEREREQGEYIHKDKVRAVAARIYGILNDHLSQLEIRIDPNGLLSADQRVRVAELGRKGLLAIHRELSDTLGVDADDDSSGPAKPARKAARAKRAPARRER